MKNILVLKTDKPSRLWLNNLLQGKLELSEEVLPYNTAQHIYITNDEEIKANVYCLINGVLCKTELLNNKIVSRQLVGGATMDICKSEYLEIILTTDQDLIADGVQAIDDEFLEWFIKNPSCEEVEVGYGVLKPFQSEDKGYLIHCPDNEVLEEPIQETLEEAAESKYNYNLFGYEKYRYGFIEGAKWQQKRMYSEEEVIAFGWLCREKALTNVDLIFEQFRKK